MFLEELKEFIRNFLIWIYFLLSSAFFFFFFGLKNIEFLGKNWLLLAPTDYSLAVQILKKIQQDLLPAGVNLIVTNPLSAFLVQIMISLLLAFMLTSPLFLYGLIKYLSPALFKQEKKAVMGVLFPSVFLFLTGCLFAYLVLIPITFKILYSYTTAIGAIPYFSINEFITLVLSLMIATGVMFLLPVFMVLLAFWGLVRADFWTDNWQYSLLFFLIFSAIITPDGTGITMIILCLPLVGLYLSGCFIIKKVELRKSRKFNHLNP